MKTQGSSKVFFVLEMEFSFFLFLLMKVSQERGEDDRIFGQFLVNKRLRKVLVKVNGPRLL